MATNLTKDPMQFMLQQLKNAEIHLSAAQDRLRKAKEKQKKKKAELGPKYKRPDLPDTNSEIRNLETKIANIKYIITCMEFAQSMRPEGFDDGKIYVYGTNKDIFSIYNATIISKTNSIDTEGYYIIKETNEVYLKYKNNNELSLRKVGVVYHCPNVAVPGINDESGYSCYDSVAQLINGLFKYNGKLLSGIVKINEDDDKIKISASYPKSSR